MAYHIDIWCISKIYDYQDAKTIFARFRPIRGGDQSIRRIGKRNDRSKWLKQEIRDGVEVYVAGFHNTDLITYYPTHYKLSMHGWTSLSTMLFIGAVLGGAVYNLKAKDYVPQGFEVPFEWDTIYKQYALNSNKVYEFDYANKPITEIDQPIKYRVNRKRMNEVRKAVKPFYTYIDTMHKLLGEGLGTDKLRSWPRYNCPTEKLISEIGNETNWWHIFEALSWDTQRRRWADGTGMIEYTRDTEAIKNTIERAIKVLNPQVLDVVN